MISDPNFENQWIFNDNDYDGKVVEVPIYYSHEEMVAAKERRHKSQIRDKADSDQLKASEAERASEKAKGCRNRKSHSPGPEDASSPDKGISKSPKLSQTFDIYLERERESTETCQS